MFSRFQIAGEALAIAALSASAVAQNPQAPINTLTDLEAALLACWVPPPMEQSRLAVCWRAVLVVPKGERPHPRRSLWHGVHLQDAADNDAIGEHVVVVIVPFADGRLAEARLRIS